MRNDRKPPGPVTLAIRAMRNDEIADDLANLSDLAVDVGNSVVAILNAVAEGSTVRAIEEGRAACAELLCLQQHVQATIGRLQAA